jgi:hypothetical protein
MRIGVQSLALLLAICCGGCFANMWHEETYRDQHTFPAADAAAAVKDENRIIGFIPSIVFKRDENSIAGMPETEAVFIRSDNDHFHITVTVRSLVRIDQPGFITVVQVDSYNIGEEGAIEAGKSVLNEIDQLYKNQAVSVFQVRPTTSQ